MTYLFRKLSKYVVSMALVAALFSNINVAYAIDCAIPTNGGPPRITQIVCPFIRIFNVAIYVVGAVFVIMIIYGGIKISMSFGDPKGLESGKLTWTHAVAGAAIVVGFFAIILIITNLLGIKTFPNPFSAFEQIVTAITKLLKNDGSVPIVTGLD